MTTTNNITGDKIATRITRAKKKFDDNIKLIKPSCYADCKYLVNTLTKCRVCDWKQLDLFPETKEKGK